MRLSGLMTLSLLCWCFFCFAFQVVLESGMSSI